ncbi:MAG: hypothetical protein JXM73_10965 [Anaerolineae bacterium]|nr:hypothetical protein [Anaerolineae bacterium]
MKGKGLFITLVLGLTLTAALLWVLGSESPPAAAAPRAPESGGDWDGLGVWTPAVILDAGTYRMWYEGAGCTFDASAGTLGYAESPDGVTWEKYAGNPILGPGEPGEWDSSSRTQIALIKEGGLYKMWYSGYAPIVPGWQVGYATSTDGLDWDIYAGNPVLEVGAPGSWDETNSDGPTVIEDGGTFKMWYHGCNADYSVCSIGYATSPDGIAWTKHASNPVLEQTPGDWDESGLLWPRVIKNGAVYEMWYRSDRKLGYATSPDGVGWTKYAGNPVLSEGWDGGGMQPPTVLLDGDTYKMWAASGAGSTAGIGYFESTDGIEWMQPVSNPILVKGEAAVIIDVRYDGNQVRALTLANTPITITVSDSGGVKATISGVTGSGGWYYSWEHYEDWSPAEPDILPGDTVSATTPSYSTIIETVGEVEAQTHNDTDLVEGTINAPWFAPGSLSVLCRTYDPDQFYLDRDVPADGGSFQCDFSGLVDIVGGMGGQAGYIEPDGDMVSVGWQAPYMEVFYGIHDGAGGLYAPGHTFWITVTNSAGDVKATGTVASTADGGWWGGQEGFRPTWTGGDCCDWSPAEPDIQPGDWVLFRSDDGYENQVRAGAIYGTVDLDNDSITGPIYASWLTETLEVWCHPGSQYPPEYRQSSAEPDGSVPYFCEWQDPGGGEPWDIQPNDRVFVHYVEPDSDLVYRVMRAADGAPLPRVYLPLVLRNYSP